MYLFPRLDPKIYPIVDDEKFVLDLLLEQKILLVQGTAFNWPNSDHFRIVFLPREDDIVEAIDRLSKFLLDYRIKHGTN
jgi:alanine-synthesizing transaminase